MGLTKYGTVVFKEYAPTQPMLLPPSLEELIAANHPSRVVNEVLDKVDIGPLLKQFKGGGTSSYHPRMLLKVLVYAYINNIYSSRQIEAAVKENIYYMWLAAMNKPDHNTINRFRSERLKEVLRKIFTEVVLLLAEEGLLSIKELYIDGTKIEANANRYSFVWGNAIKTNKEKMKKQLNELWEYAQTVAAEELEGPEPPDFEQIDSHKVKQTIEQIDAALKDKPVNKQVKAKLNYAKKNWPDNLDKYAAQEQILDGRNSYSKTDTDATFMRMKEDHMKNGQLKPGYNLQVAASEQFIVDYTLHPNPTDTRTLATHIEQYKTDYGTTPEVITADAGYGSLENYTYLAAQGIEQYVKYNYFDKDQSDNYQSKHPFTADKLYYNKEKNYYICPMGQQMHHLGSYSKVLDSGFVQLISRYQAQNCSHCPLKGTCHKAKGNRIIEINQHLNQLKKEVRAQLTSEKGIYHRKRRPVMIEPIFANIKHNHGFRRFMLRGKDKVEVETGLLALAHNLRKKCA